MQRAIARQSNVHTALKSAYGVAAQQSRSSPDRIVDATLDHDRSRLVDDGSDIGPAIERVATAQRARPVDDSLRQRVGDPIRNDDPLDHGTALAGVAERACHSKSGGLVEICVGQHDQRVAGSADG